MLRSLRLSKSSRHFWARDLRFHFATTCYESISTKKLRIEVQGDVETHADPDRIITRLETYHVPPNEEAVFVFIGHIWEPAEAASKDATALRTAFGSIMPFYEELILASGSYYFQLA